MRVYWSDEASHRLREITSYIAKDSPAAAQEVAKRLLMYSRTLAVEAPPLLGRRLPEYPDTELCELLKRPYRLIFERSARGIEIVTVMHYRQLLPENPNELRGI
jgi:toxin ParE1/3/4